MMEPLSCLRIDPAPFRHQPISRNIDKQAIRFELKRQACQSLRKVLQLKLQQRRTREELVNQGIMPPLKGSAAFHEQRLSLERARMEDYLKRKIKCRPERAELIRMHILEETLVEPSLQAKQLQLKRARLADDLNDKISHRPGPMELIHNNILPVHSIIKQAIIETDFPVKVSAENLSLDEDSFDSLSPEHPGALESPLSMGPLHSPPETAATLQSPTQYFTQVPLHLPPVPPTSSPSPSSAKLANGPSTPAPQRTTPSTQMKAQPKSSSDRAAQRSKKAKDTKPKIKKLKYHQYIPPDQKGDPKEPPPILDSSYAKILQQQQLFLQLQILSQQQQHYNYHTILPATHRSQTDQQPAEPPASQHAAPSSPACHPAASCSQAGRTTAAHGGSKPERLPMNLDEMKMAELRSELKMRSLPVSGTKSDLIDRLRAYQLRGAAGTASSLAAGGAIGPGAGGSSRSFTNTSHRQHLLAAAGPLPFQSATFGRDVPSVSARSPAPRHHSSTTMSPGDPSYNSDTLAEMVSSPLNQLSLHPSPVVTVKEEPASSPPASCPCPGTLAPPLDKDGMLREKDQQIQLLTAMLLQKQRLVEALRLQLERQSRRGGEGVAEPPGFLLLRVKEEPPDAAPPSPDREAPAEASVKQESPEAPPPGLLSAGEEQDVAAETDERPRRQLCLQQMPLQLAQHRAIQKLLLQQQGDMHNHDQKIPDQRQSLQKRSQQKKIKSHKQQEKQQLLHSQHTQQQQQQHQQAQHIQSSAQLKQLLALQAKHQLIIQQKLPAQQRSPQMSHMFFNNQSGSTPSLPLDLFNTGSTRTLVTDSNGNHFLIGLTNHKNGKQESVTPESEVTNHITVQVQKTGHEVLSDQSEQGLPQSFSATSHIKNFFLAEKTAPSGKDALSASLQANTDLIDDFSSYFDILFQTGEISSSFKPSPDPSLDLFFSAEFSTRSAPPSPPRPPAPHTPSVDRGGGVGGGGRLEDFLESTTGKPLLGAEPGGPLTLIDDLHSQMLSTPSILDHRASPMDTYELAPPYDSQGLDGMDWLDLSMGEGAGQETTSLTLLGPHTPTSVFSTDFLDSSDLYIHWDL